MGLIKANPFFLSHFLKGDRTTITAVTNLPRRVWYIDSVGHVLLCAAQSDYLLYEMLLQRYRKHLGTCKVVF